MNSSAIKIKVENLDTLQGMVAQLNRRAQKLGLDAHIELTVGRKVWERVPGDLSDTRMREMVEVTLDGKAPVIPGWRFAAVIERVDGTNQNLITANHYNPIEIPDRYRTAAMICDHCHTQRDRKSTVVLLSDSGEFIQVGRQCLKDYTRCEDAEGALAIWKLACEIEIFCELDPDDEGFGGIGYRGAWELATYLGYVAAVIRTDGWVPRSAADGRTRFATADCAWVAMLDDTSRPRKIDSRDAEVARASIEWAMSIDPATANDYEHNLRAVALGGAVTTRLAGVAASIVAAHTKAKAKAVEAARARNAGYFGEVGKKIELTLTLLRRYVCEGAYGYTTILAFVDAEGHNFVWKASGNKDADVGVDYLVRGTIKSHAEYRGTPQTNLTRCKMCLDRPTRSRNVTRMHEVRAREIQERNAERIREERGE